MTKSFYFIREFGGLLNGNRSAKVAGAIFSIFAFIILIYALLLPKNQPLQVSSGLEKFPQDHKTLAQIEPGLSSTAIDELYLSLRRLNSVDNLILVLSEEVKRGILNVPPEMSEESNFFLIKTDDREQLLDELKTQPRIQMVTRISGQITRSGSESFSLWLKIIILAIGVAFAGLAFYLLRSVTEDVLEGWEGELQIIKYSGLSRFSVKFPLAMLGTLFGLLGSVLSVVALFVLSLLADNGVWLIQSLPGLPTSTSLLLITVWSLLLGLVLGFLASLSSLRVVDLKWDSKSSV
jgi:cell division protein FtsX